MPKIAVLFLARPGFLRQTGGDMLHLQATAQALKKQGVQVTICQKLPANVAQFDLIHCFNLGKPQWILPLFKTGLPVVLSSVYVDYRQTEKQKGLGHKVLVGILGAHGLEYLKNLARFAKGQETFPSWRYLLLGHKAAVKIVLQNTALLITASNAEYHLIKKVFRPAQKQISLRLGLEHFPQQPPAKKRLGVLCAARIEPLKNQLALIKACQKLGLPLTLAGPVSRNHQAYFKKCKAAADGNVRFTGLLGPKALATEMAQCAVHALPSFYESTGLSTLEALKNGAAVVVGDSPITRELFVKQAHFCQPGSVESIIAALQAALKHPNGKSVAAQNQKELNTYFSWQLSAQKLIEEYKTLCKPVKN
jgi:glycosyltransferase involved in cell wall biosynthesis